MEQDWTPVVFKKKAPAKKILPKNGLVANTVKKASGGKNSQTIQVNSKKIEEAIDNDEFIIPKISVDTKTQIQQGRQVKGLTQKQLAQKCNLPENVIKDYEQGKGVPKKQDLVKIGKVLGITIKN
jgi:putative transcription factor